jgi:hypothetical protein
MNEVQWTVPAKLHPLAGIGMGGFPAFAGFVHKDDLG